MRKRTVTQRGGLQPLRHDCRSEEKVPSVAFQLDNNYVHSLYNCGYKPPILLSTHHNRLDMSKVIVGLTR